MLNFLQEFFGSHSYTTLFVLSFLAATILPIGSEWLLALMVMQGFHAGSVVAVATVGNFLGACTTYLIGLYGSSYIFVRLLSLKESTIDKAETMFRRYGSWVLFFSWLPIIGDPLCFTGGVFSVPFFRFSVFVFSGKIMRYALLAYLIKSGID